MSPAYIARHPMTASRLLGDEMIVMSAGDARLFTLNGVGAAIWSAADGLTPLDQIVRDAVCAVFEVEPEVALTDAETFVAELVEQGVLVQSAAPIDAAGPAV